jgi:hypothetical protein
VQQQGAECPGISGILRAVTAGPPCATAIELDGVLSQTLHTIIRQAFGGLPVARNYNKLALKQLLKAYQKNGRHGTADAINDDRVTPRYTLCAIQQLAECGEFSYRFLETFNHKRLF